MPFTFENFNYSGYLKMLGADDATANRELNDEERSSIYSDAVGRMFKEAAQESKNNPFLSTPKERYEYALEETLKMFPDARSAFNIPEERTTEEAFDPEEFRAFVANHEVETEDIGFYLDDYAKTRINNYTKWQFPGLGNMTSKQFKDIFSERNDITEGMTRDEIIQGKFGKGYVDTSLPSSNAKTGYGAAAVHSWYQMKELGWKTLQTIRDALPGENTESSAWVDRFVDEAKESVEKYNYQSRYPKTLGATLNEDGFWAAVGKVFTSAVESWATSGASILTAVASAPLTGGTSVAAQVIGRGLQMISVMSSLQEIGGAREELERQGLYDPDNPIDAVIAGTISASLDHVAAFNAGYRVLAGKGKNVLTATTHGGTAAQGLERAGIQRYWFKFAQGISALGDTYGGRVLRAMGTEGWTEAAQELPAMWAASRKGAEYSLSDYLNRTAEAGLVGALMGGGTHVLGTISQSYADSRKSKREDAEAQRNRDVLNQRYNEEGMPHVVDQPDIAVREQHEKMFGADAQIFVTENGNTVVAVYGDEIVEVSYDKNQHGEKTDEEKFTFLRDKAQRELLDRVNANRVEMNPGDIITTSTRTTSTSKITVDDPLQPGKKMTVVVEGGNSEAILEELIRRHQDKNDPLVFRKGMRISEKEIGGEVTKESAANYVVNENNIYRGKGRTRFTLGGNDVLSIGTTVSSEQDAKLGEKAEQTATDGGYQILKMSADRKKLTLTKDGLIFDVSIENIGGKKLGVGSGNYGIRARVKITDPVTGNNTEYTQLLRQEAAKRDSETGYGDVLNENIDIAVPSSIIRLIDQPGGGKYLSNDDLEDFAKRVGGEIVQPGSEESPANVRRVAINYTDNNGEKKQKILSFYVFSGKKNSEGKSTTTVFVHDGKRFVTNPETVEDFAPLFEQGMESQVNKAVRKFGLSTASGAANTAKALGFTVYRWRSGQSSANIKEEAYIFEREVDGKTVWIEVYSAGRVEDGAKRTTHVYYKVYTSDDDVAYFNRIAAIQKANTAEDIERVFGKQFFRTFVYRTSNGTYCTPKSGETTKLEEAYWTHNRDNVPATFEAVEVLMIHHKDCAKAVVATLASDEKEFVRLAKLYAKAVDMRDGNIEPPTLKLKETPEQREQRRAEEKARKEAEKAEKEANEAERKKKEEKDEYQKKTEELVNQLRSDQQPALPKKTKTGWTNKSLLFRKERETDANGREHKYIVIRDRNGIEYNRGEYRNDGEMFEVVANMLNNQEEMTPRNFIIPDESSRKVVDQIRRRTFVDLSDRVENGEGLSLLLVGGTKGDSSPLRLELRRKKDKKKGLSRENTEAIGEAYTVELEYTNDESLYNAYEEILDALNALDEDTISTLFVTPEDEATEGAVGAFNEAGVSVSEEEEQQQEQEIVPAITPEEKKAAFIKSMDEDGSVIRDGRTFIVRKHTSKDAWVVEIREGDKEPDRFEFSTREEALNTAYGIAVGEVIQGDGAPAPKKTRKKSKKAEQQQEQQQEQKPKKTTGRKKPTPTEDAIVSLNSVDAIKKRVKSILRKISTFDKAIKDMGSKTAPQAANHENFKPDEEAFNKAIEEAKESGDLTNLQDTVRRYTKEFFSRFTLYMQYVAEANGINATNGVKPGLSIRPNDTVDNVRERAANVIRDIDAKLTEKGEDMQSALQKIAKKSDASFFAEISEKIRKNAKDIVVLSIDSGNDTVENAVRQLSRKMAIHNTVAEIVEAKLLSNNRLSELLANDALVVLHTQREARDLIERNTGVDPLYNKSGKIQGFVLKGKVYIVADSTQGKVTGVLLHELGVHFKKMGLRASKYEALLADLQDRMAAAQAAESRGEQLTSEQVELLAAFERAKGAHLDASDSRYWHEIAAYLVENNAKHNEGIIGRIVSYFKRFLYNWGLIGVENISYRDMVMFARGSVRSARLANFNLTYSETVSENDFLNSIFESLNPSVVTDTDKDTDKERRKEEFKKEVEELKEKGRKESYRAPNGKKSKLVRGTGPHYDERLWAIVRTTAFRNWFGDWLNASEEEKANMILDENGEPLLVFRGENTYEKEEVNITQGEVRREFMPSRIILEDYSSDAGRHFSHDYHLALGMINGSGNYPFLRQFTLRRGLVRNGDSNDLRATIYAGFISTKGARLVETEDFFGSSIYSALAKFKTEGILPLEVYNDILDTASEFDSTEIYDYYEERDEHILETFGEDSEELRQLREEFQQELQKNKAAWNKLHDYLREHHPNLILKYDNKGEAGDIRADYQGKEANWSFAIFDSSRFKDIDNNGLFSQEKDVFASVSSAQESDLPLFSMVSYDSIVRLAEIEEESAKLERWALAWDLYGQGVDNDTIRKLTGWYRDSSKEFSEAWSYESKKSVYIEEYETALRMEEEGRSEKEIKLLTNWYRGNDGIWRYELSNSDAQVDIFSNNYSADYFNRNYFYDHAVALLNPESDNFDLREVQYLAGEFIEKAEKDLQLAHIFYDEKLFSAYKKAFENVNIRLSDKVTDVFASLNNHYYAGKYTITLNLIPLLVGVNSYENFNKKLKNVILHEVQHIIQEESGFSPGGSASLFKNFVDDSWSIKDVQDRYLHLIGEVEARVVEARSNLTQEELRKIPVSETEKELGIEKDNLRDAKVLFPEVYDPNSEVNRLFRFFSQESRNNGLLFSIADDGMAENDNSPLLSVADNNIGRPVRYAPGVYVRDDGTFNYVEEEMPEGRTTETLLYGVVRANKGARNTELVRNLKTFLSGNTDVRNRAYSYLTSSDVRAEDLRDENIVFALTSRWVLRNEEEARTIPMGESNLYDQTLLALQDAGGTALGTFEVNEWTDEMMASVANAIGGLTNEQPLFSDKPPTAVPAVGGNRFVDQEIFADVDNVIGQNDELVQLADFDEKGRAIITPTTEENSDEQEDGFTYIIDVDPNAKLANGQVAATEGEKRAALRQTIDRLTEKGIGNYTPYDDFYKDDGTTPIFMQTGAQNTGIAQPAANMRERVDAFLAEALPEHIRERIHIHYDKASAPTILNRAFGVFFPFARGKKMIHVRAWDRTFGQVIATVAHEASHFGWAMWRSPDLSRAIAKMFDMKTLDGRTVKDVMYDTIPRYFHMFGIDGSNLNSVPDPVRVYLTNEFFARMNHSLLGNNTNDIAKDLGVDHKDYLAIKKEVFDAVAEVQTDLAKVLTNVASPDVLAAFTRDITEMTMGTTIGRGVDAYYTTQNWDNGSGKMIKRGTVHIYVNDYGQSRREVREGRLGTQIDKTKEVIDKWQNRFGSVGRAFAYFVLQNFPMNNGFRGFGKEGDFWYIPGLHVEGSKLGEQIATSRAAVMIGHVMRKVSEEIGGELRRKYDAYSDLEAAMRDRHFDPNILTGKAQQPGQAPLTYKQVIEDLGLGDDAELVRKAEMADASIMWCRNQILSNAIAIRRTIMEQADALAERMRAAFPAEPDLDVNEYIDRMYSNMTEMASKISGDWTHRMYRAYSEEGYLELSQMLNYLNVNPSTGRLRLKEEQELAEREIAKLNALKSKPVDQGGITLEHYREAIEKPQKIVKLAYRLDELEAYVKQRIGIKRAISKAENYPSLVLETMRREIQEIMMQSRKHYSGAMGNDHLNTIPSMMGRKLDPSIEVDYHYMNFLDPETNVLKTLLHSVDQQNKILMKLTFNRELGEHILDTGMGNFRELFGGKRSSSEIGFLEKGSFLQYIAIDPLFQEALEKEYNIQKSLRETVWGGVIDSWKANNTIYSFKLGMSNYIGNISLLAAGGHFFRWGNMKVGSGIAWEQWKERLGFSDGKWEGNAGKIMELMRKHHLIGGTVSDTRMIVGQTGVHEKVLHTVFQGLREIDAIGFMGQRQMENTVKRILEKFRQFYAFGDEWIKPIIFLNNYNVALAKYEAGLLDSEDAAAREAAEQTMRETTTWEMTSRMARELSARSIRIFTPDFVMHNFQMLRILAANFVREREISRELAALGDKNSLDEKRKAYRDELIDERVRRRIGGAFTLSTYTSLMVTGMGVIPFLTNMLIAALGGDAGDDDDERREKFEKNPDAKHGFNMREWDGAVRVANWMTGGNNLHAPFIRDKWNMYTWNYVRSNAMLTHAIPHPPNENWKPSDMVFQMAANLMDLHSGTMTQELINNALGRDKWGKEIGWEAGWLKILDRALIPGTLRQMLGVTVGYPQTDTLYHTGREIKIPELAGITVNKYDMRDVANRLGYFLKEKESDQRNYRRGNFVSALEKGRVLSDGEIVNLVRDMKEYNRYEKGKADYLLVGLREFGLTEKELTQYLTTSRKGGSSLLGKDKTSRYLKGENILDTGLIEHLGNKRKNLIKSQRELRMSKEELATVLQNYDKAIRIYSQALRTN